MLSLVTLVTSTMSRKTAGNSLVSRLCSSTFTSILNLFPLGNYDISKLHYDGPGDVAGSPGHGYGYNIRVEGRTSANPPEATAAA